jgi:hypothetical protein
MAVKKSTETPSPRRTSRIARPQTPSETAERSASQTVSTAGMTAGTARNAVIEGNATINLDDVRQRAYELYEERGRAEGFHEEDWRRAEEEVRARQNRKQTFPPRKKSA